MEEPKRFCLIISSDLAIKNEFSKLFKGTLNKFSQIKSTKNLYANLKKNFNACILDIDNIDVDILRLAENIKIFAPAIPIIAITSTKSFSLSKSLLKCDIFDLISKPLSKKEITATVEDAISESFNRRNTARLLKLAQQRSYDIMLLKEIAESASKKSLSIVNLFEKIVDMIANLLDVQVVSIMMLNEKTDTLTVNAYKGPRKKYAHGVKIKVGEGVAGFVAKTGEPLLVNNVAKSKHFSPSGWSKAYSTQSLLSVPIKLDENIMGIINVNNKIDDSEFNENDQNVLTTISHQVAMSIENFRLFFNLRKKAAQLEKSNKKLFDLNAAKSLLLCNLSHELKTPLTSVIGYLELVLTFTKDDSEEERKKFLDIIHGESLEIAQLIDNILNFFNLETNKIEWDIVPINLSKVLDEVITKYKPKMEKNRINFTYTNNLKSLAVNADHKMLKTAIEHLFDNAIKFNDDRCKMTMKVEKAKDKKTDMVRVTIFNTGALIKRTDKERIFKDFYQPGNIMTEKPLGLGLGLATTKGIIKKHNGNVYLNVSNKKGNTFVCTIPIL